jgi:hypothetical protein
MDDSYLSFTEQAPRSNTGWDRVSREVELVTEAVSALPAAAYKAFSEHPEKTAIQIAAAGALSLGLAYTRGRTGALATVVRGLGVGVGVATVVDLQKNLIPITIAASQAWDSAEHFEENKRTAREHLAPFLVDVGISSAAAFGGGYVGGRLYRASLKTGATSDVSASSFCESLLDPKCRALLEAAGNDGYKAATQQVLRFNTPEMAMKPVAKLTGAEQAAIPQLPIAPASEAVSVPPRAATAAGKDINTPLEPPSAAVVPATKPGEIRESIMGNRALIEKKPFEFKLEQAVADLRSGDFSTHQATHALTILRQQFGQPPTAQSTAILCALQECKITWAQFDNVVSAANSVDFGWPCVEALPVVKSLHAAHPELYGHVKLASKFKPESLQPIRDIYYAANPVDQSSIIKYLQAQYVLQARGSNPMVAAHCDKWPAYKSLIHEFVGLPPFNM